MPPARIPKQSVVFLLLIWHLLVVVFAIAAVSTLPVGHIIRSVFYLFVATPHTHTHIHCQCWVDIGCHRRAPVATLLCADHFPLQANIWVTQRNSTYHLHMLGRLCAFETRANTFHPFKCDFFKMMNDSWQLVWNADNKNKHKHMQANTHTYIGAYVGC